MNFMKQNFEHIHTRGINLNHIGINAYAYDYLVIPDILDNLKANNQIILGGDVFCYKNGQLKHTDDHWYYEKQVQPLIAVNPLFKQKNISATMLKIMVNTIIFQLF